MKYQFTRSGFALLMLFFVVNGFSQTVTELVIPKYFGSKTAAATNNARTAFAVCFKIDGLTPATSYDLKPGIGLVADAASSYGAGNFWNVTAFSGTGKGAQASLEGQAKGVGNSVPESARKKVGKNIKRSSEHGSVRGSLNGGGDFI